MIKIIVACSRNRVIGKDGRLPWVIREDWEYFLEQTRQGTLIMGRRCHREMGKHLKERRVIALSRDPNLCFADARKAGSLKEALQMARADDGDVWICGGQTIYEEAMPLAEQLYLTLIDADFEGDVFFPPWEKHFPRELSRREIVANGIPVSFYLLSR
ncbi:MAG: dihydrofolate reductase [Opitutae bacterium]|nr:dihydrofolate reductase [Opitutae bacterium]|tara:strand:+ start:1878 stop:2351 length:474 start_codon:yes stop_codon:yes gene_type:complete